MIIKTRKLNGEEASEFLDWMFGLQPAYKMTEDFDPHYIRIHGGELTISTFPEHDREAIYAKVKWG